MIREFVSLAVKFSLISVLVINLRPASAAWLYQFPIADFTAEYVYCKDERVEYGEEMNWQIPETCFWNATSFS